MKRKARGGMIKIVRKGGLLQPQGGANLKRKKPGNVQVKEPT